MRGAPRRWHGRRVPPTSTQVASLVRRALVRPAAAVVVAALVLVPAAHAGTPGDWEPLAESHATTVFQPALTRDAAGDLHVANVLQRPGGTLDLFERRVLRSGRLDAQRPVLGGFVTLGDPALLPDGAGLRVLVGAQRSVDTEDPVNGLLTAAAPAAGGAWGAPSVTTSQDGEAGLRAGDVAAIALPGGGPLALSSGTGFVIDGPDGNRIFDVDGSSQAQRLDVVASSGAVGSRPFHTQVLPPLELTASPQRFRGGAAVSVRFKVTDVGVPVAGVVVRAGGRQATTGSGGSARLTLRGPRDGGSIGARASKRNYATDRLTLTVRRARNAR